MRLAGIHTLAWNANWSMRKRLANKVPVTVTFVNIFQDRLEPALSWPNDIDTWSFSLVGYRRVLFLEDGTR